MKKIIIIAIIALLGVGSASADSHRHGGERHHRTEMTRHHKSDKKDKHHKKSDKKKYSKHSYKKHGDYRDRRPHSYRHHPPREVKYRKPPRHHRYAKHHHHHYSRDERMYIAMDFIRANSFLDVARYAALTGLSEAMARIELDEFVRDAAIPIGYMMRGGVRNYIIINL